MIRHANHYPKPHISMAVFLHMDMGVNVEAVIFLSFQSKYKLYLQPCKEYTGMIIFVTSNELKRLGQVVTPIK